MYLKFDKPLSKDYLAIQDWKIEKALKAKAKIVLYHEVDGEKVYWAIADPQIFKKGKKMEKSFLYPDNPMRLFQGYVKLLDENEAEKIKYNNVL